MTLYQFERLSEYDQEFIIQRRAVHIASVVDRKNILTLFQLDGFYLEIQTCAGQFCKTSCFFEETEMLEPYLKVVNIDEVYELL
jgi:hypothetical protein